MAEIKVGENKESKKKIRWDVIGFVAGTIFIIAIVLIKTGGEKVEIKGAGAEAVREEFRRFEESYTETNRKLIQTLEKLQNEIKNLRQEISTLKEERGKIQEEVKNIPVSIPPPEKVKKEEKTFTVPLPPPEEKPSTEFGWEELSYIKKVKKTKVEFVQKKEKENSLILPPGTILKVKNVGKIIAPVVPSYPATVFVVEDVILPNFKKAPVRDCFLIGKPKGNWNTSRVEVQAVSMSCVKDGKVFTADINGWTKGEDEADGLIGKVRYMRGKEVAIYFSSVFLRSFAGAMAEAQTQRTAIVSPSGTLQSNIVQDSFTYSIWKSIEESIKAITDFYIQNANQIFPVVTAEPQTAYVILINTAILKEVRA